jgi:RNA polymerase sigma-70 factor (ECF subfamily)
LEQDKKISMLIDACRHNHQKAQTEIYRLYYKAMYNTALRIVGNSDDAEDVMQEAFIKAFDKIHSYSAKATFGAWLKRIVINESISWIRKNTKMELVDNFPVSTEPETELEINDNDLEIQQVMTALNNLKSNYKIILSLHFIEGYDYEELTEILNISYANVRTMIFRAKSSLKKELLKIKKVNKYEY